MPKSVHSEAYRVFCALLTQGREEAGLTQTALAERLGKPQSFVSKYEAAERRLDVVEFLEIAKVLGLDVHAFLDRLLPSI